MALGGLSSPSPHPRGPSPVPTVTTPPGSALRCLPALVASPQVSAGKGLITAPGSVQHPPALGGLSDSLGQTGVLLPLRPVCAVGLLCHNCVTVQRLSPQQTTGLTGWGPRLSLLLSLTERGARGRPTLGVCRGVTSGWYRTLTLGLRHTAARRCPANAFSRGRTLRNWLQVTPRTSGPWPSRVCTYHVSPLSDVLAAYAGHAVDGSWFDVP